MAKQVIDVGVLPNDGLGDSTRAALMKCNANFTELYDYPYSTVAALGASAGIVAPADVNPVSSVDEPIVYLADTAETLLDAALGRTFYLGATGNRKILIPIHPPVGMRTQRIWIQFEAVGDDRMLALATGLPGAFRFGAEVPALTGTVIGSTDYVGCVWNQPQGFWDVILYSKGKPASSNV